MTNLSHSILKKMPVFIPSLNEQRRIILFVEDFHRFCDVLKTRLQSAHQTQLYLADTLTDAALN